MRKTKIVATLGPASNTVEICKNLIRAGMDAARINFSHGTYESHTEIINTLVQARTEMNAPVSLILDTKGPEIRIRDFSEDKVYLEQGQTFMLTTESLVGDNTKVAITYENLPKDVQRGSRILIDDGLIEMVVESLTDTDIVCKVINSGFLSSKKGVNVPDVYVNLPSLTEKDVEDIKFGVKMGFDYIAASFIRSAKDVVQIREILESCGAGHINIIAKIESRDGVNNIDSILEVADGIMVARGDLGVEIPPEEVPLVQKLLIKKANMVGKPVITATQMLESMVNNPRPTRAEANDVANAIFDGSDCIMLSGETAKGKYPVESVQMMARIAVKAEDSIDYHERLRQAGRSRSGVTITNAVSRATCTSAADLNAAAIVTVTNSGFTARMIAKYKPACPVVAVSLREVVWRQLNLVWGCHSIMGEIKDDTEQEIFDLASAKALESKIVKNGDLIVVVAGVPVGVAGSTNMIKIEVVGDVLARGVAHGEGVVSGQAAVIKVADEGASFMPDDILVTTETNDKMMSMVRKAKAVIIGSDQPINTLHAETACLALQIPLLICTERVVDLIQTGAAITIDMNDGFVYNGIKG